MGQFNDMGKYEHIYRGVFLSPLDYSLACSYKRMAELDKLMGESLTTKQSRACNRLAKLEELGGVREWPKKPLTDQQIEEIIEMVQNVNKN